MSKQTKKALVPALRFPEFREAGEWKQYQLGQCLTQHPEYGINAPAVPFSENLPTYLRITDISEDGYFLENQKVSVAKKVTSENYLSEGDIVLARTGASVGKSYKYREKDGKLVFAGFLIRVKPDEKKLNSELLFQFLATGQYWRWVNLTSARSGQPGINGNEYSLLLVFLPPSLIEQQKIADCLSSIDGLITAQTQKLDALKAHKKGLMQQLFPAEGETVPKLRFSRFRDAGEWKEKPIKKVFSIFQGFAFSSNDSAKDGVRWLKIADVSIQQMDHGNPSYLPIEHKEKYEKFSVNHGDYVIALTRPILSKQLKIAPVDSVFDGALLNQRVGKLVTSQNTAFVYYFLQTAQLINEIEKNIAGSEPPNLSAQQIEDIKVYIPLEKEQQKIADCLSSIDDLINAQTQKLAALKAHKKGLMQQLFPAAVEAVG